MKIIYRLFAIIVCTIVFIVFWGSLLEHDPWYLLGIANDKYNQLQDPIIYKKGLIENIPEKVIILRIDDVQAYAWTDVTKKMVDMILKRDMSVVLAVIPSRDLSADIETKNYLIKISKDKRVEIAQHGLLHTPNEFMNLSYEDNYEKIKEGKNLIIKELKVQPITFIPPYNVYTNETEKALIDLNFTILSAGRNEFSLDKNITKIGFNAESKVSDSNELLSADEIMTKCDESLKRDNVCVIMLHLQDYATDGVLDKEKIKKFEDLLDRIDVNTTTFREMVSSS